WLVRRARRDARRLRGTRSSRGRTVPQSRPARASLAVEAATRRRESSAAIESADEELRASLVLTQRIRAGTSCLTVGSGTASTVHSFPFRHANSRDVLRDHSPSLLRAVRGHRYG